MPGRKKTLAMFCVALVGMAVLQAFIVFRRSYEERPPALRYAVRTDDGLVFVWWPRVDRTYHDSLSVFVNSSVTPLVLPVSADVFATGKLRLHNYSDFDNTTEVFFVAPNYRAPGVIVEDTLPSQTLNASKLTLSRDSLLVTVQRLPCTLTMTLQAHIEGCETFHATMDHLGRVKSTNGTCLNVAKTHFSKNVRKDPDYETTATSDELKFRLKRKCNCPTVKAATANLHINVAGMDQS